MDTSLKLTCSFFYVCVFCKGREMTIFPKNVVRLRFFFFVFLFICFVLVVKRNLEIYSRHSEHYNTMDVADVETRTPPLCRANRTILRKLQEIALASRFQDSNCAALFSGDVVALQEAAVLSNFLRGGPDVYFYLNETRSCHRFQSSRGYVMSSLTSEEEDFPIAYSLIIYTDLEMAERLLRAIYRPQNFYCLHVDIKVSRSYFTAISAIAACFPNVFIASRRLNVVWGTFSVLKVELVCMRELWAFKSWKYFINLAGQEFPLRTNLELVRILKAFNGANSVSGRIKDRDKARWKHAKPLTNVRPIKGSLHIVVNRHFVDYILHNQTALKILSWTRRTKVPDETFFPTLNFNPNLNITGSYSGSPNELKQFVNRYKIWYTRHLCAGHFRRGICMLSTGDLHRLGQANHLFANKFLIQEDRVAIGCLEEKLANDTRDEYACVKKFDATFYSQLDFVKKQIRG